MIATPLRDHNFTAYLGARLASAVGIQMLIVAVGWQVYHLTGRVLDLGLIGLSQFLPFLCLSLFAGHAADHYDRARILALCMAAFLVAAALLWSFAAMHFSQVTPIFAVLGLLGVARAFLAPASQSFVANLVPPAALGRAIALSSSSFQTATIVGPSLGGVVYAVGGATAVYAAALALFGAGVCLMLRVKPRASKPPSSGVALRSLFQGVRFVWHRKTVLGAISLDLFAVLFGGASALLPAFTRDVLHAGPEVFGYLRAGPGIGAVLCAAWLAFHPIRRRIGVWMFGGVALYGAATVVFGLTRHLWVALACLVLMGAGDMVSVFIRTLLVQLETPDEIRGRVSAVNSVIIGASNELGEFESGFTAAWFGLVPAIVLGGVVTLGVTGLWAWGLFPRLWRLQTFESPKDDPSNGP